MSAATGAGTTSARSRRETATSAYSVLLAEVRDAGLLRRRRGFYASLGAALLALLTALGAVVVMLGDSWFQLLVAAALGLLLGQLGFLAHEAAHRQVFSGGRANDLAALIVGDLVVGMSRGWWNDGHVRHHANPNRIGTDPSVERAVVSFTEEDAARARGLGAAFTRHQGAWFFPLLLLEGVNLHAASVRAVLSHGRIRQRGAEIALLAVRFAVYPGLLPLVMPLGIAAAFFAVQLAVFGIYIGTAFAVNHIGMPLIAPDDRIDYLRRQVATSRNIRSGAIGTALMGGLNYQIEHHLFPSMPRPALARTRRLVRRSCADLGLDYTERGIAEALRDVVTELDRVGLAAGRHPWVCPVVAGARVTGGLDGRGGDPPSPKAT